jgi:hypothetical protein
MTPFLKYYEHIWFRHGWPTQNGQDLKDWTRLSVIDHAVMAFPKHDPILGAYLDYISQLWVNNQKNRQLHNIYENSLVDPNTGLKKTGTSRGLEQLTITGCQILSAFLDSMAHNSPVTKKVLFVNSGYLIRSNGYMSWGLIGEPKFNNKNVRDSDHDLFRIIPNGIPDEGTMDEYLNLKSQIDSLNTADINIKIINEEEIDTTTIINEFEHEKKTDNPNTLININNTHSYYSNLYNDLALNINNFGYANITDGFLSKNIKVHNLVSLGERCLVQFEKNKFFNSDVDSKYTRKGHSHFFDWTGIEDWNRIIPAIGNKLENIFNKELLRAAIDFRKYENFVFFLPKIHKPLALIFFYLPIKNKSIFFLSEIKEEDSVLLGLPIKTKEKQIYIQTIKNIKPYNLNNF